MKSLIVFAVMAIASASASGLIGGAILKGPSGIVTGAGPIGPAGIGLGWGAPTLGLAAAPLAKAVVAGPAIGAAATLVAPSQTAVISGPAWGGLGLGVAPLGLGIGAVGLGKGIITNGGGTIGLSGHGVAVKGPPTAPAVVAGPSGKIVADGLWGPTLNVGKAW